MDDMREKLAELVCQVQDCGCDVTDVVEMNYVKNNVLIDHLIANGVRLEEKQATSDKTSKWIPVSERLPEYGSNVFVFCNDRSVDCRAYYGFFEKTLRVNYGKITLAEVTHWMPLPQPPKGE